MACCVRSDRASGDAAPQGLVPVRACLLEADHLHITFSVVCPDCKQHICNARRSTSDCPDIQNWIRMASH
jgi:hypothetical protein